MKKWMRKDENGHFYWSAERGSTHQREQSKTGQVRVDKHFDKPQVIHSVDKWAKGFKHYDTDPKSLTYGQPVVTARNQVEGVIAANPGSSYNEGRIRNEWK